MKALEFDRLRGVANTNANYYLATNILEASGTVGSSAPALHLPKPTAGVGNGERAAGHSDDRRSATK